MTGSEKKKVETAIEAKTEMKWKKGSPDICEICGRRMERDPESGEYFCPDCDDSDL